jgi:predicted dehydrogenase
MAPGFGFVMAFTLGFERGVIDFDGSRASGAFRVVCDGNPPWPLPPPGDGYEGEVRHLVDAIRSGTPPSVVTPADGLAALQVCEAEERSIRSGAIEPVPAS